jgi:hypothetical protein
MIGEVVLVGKIENSDEMFREGTYVVAAVDNDFSPEGGIFEVLERNEFSVSWKNIRTSEISSVNLPFLFLLEASGVVYCRK